jgi:ribonuclease-3
VTGEQHAQQFRVICLVEELDRSSQGGGSSRRRAEQDAAERLLNSLLEDD